MKQLTRNEIIDLIENADEFGNYIDGELVLNTLEKAGVLMLVDDEPNSSLQADEQIFRFSNDKYLKGECKIIQRNNIPVYQCKKEVV